MDRAAAAGGEERGSRRRRRSTGRVGKRGFFLFFVLACVVGTYTAALSWFRHTWPTCKRDITYLWLWGATAILPPGHSQCATDKRYSSGAPQHGAPLITKNSSGALFWCATGMLSRIGGWPGERIAVAHQCGAPLKCATGSHLAVAHQAGASLLGMLAVAHRASAPLWCATGKLGRIR